MVPHRRAERQSGHGAVRKAPPWLVLPGDSGFRHIRAKLPEQARSECAILFSVLPRSGVQVPEGGRWSWFRWFSWV